MSSDVDILKVGFCKGEIDFSVSGGIAALSYEQMQEFRAMCVVALGVAETEWRNAREKLSPAVKSNASASASEHPTNT